MAAEQRHPRSKRPPAHVPEKVRAAKPRKIVGKPVEAPSPSSKDWGGDVVGAVGAGDHVGSLRAMALKLAEDFRDAPPTVSAQVAARLQAVLAELHGAAPVKVVSGLDEIAKRREDRIAAAKISKPAR